MGTITNTWDRGLGNAWMAAKLGGPTGASSPWTVGLLDDDGVEFTSSEWSGYARKQISFGSIAPSTTNLYFVTPDDDETIVLQNVTKATWGPWTDVAVLGGYLLFNSDADAVKPLLTVNFSAPNGVGSGLQIVLRKGSIALTLAQLRGR